MSNKVDKLFKDKLEGHSLPPSAQAWEKVEAHLGKKNRMAIFLRVAAAVVMLGVLTFVGVKWNAGYEEPKREIVSKETGVSGKEAVDGSEEKVTSDSTANENRSVKPATRNKKQETPNTEYQTPKAEQPVEQIAVVIEPEVVTEPTTPNPQPTTNTAQPATKKGITLTYSLPPITKEEPVAIAQNGEKKTGIERVLEIAREVKNGDNPLGELREAKNDILALEFRKDKNKKN